MTYQYKVGDKGKTRGGRKYEIICVTRRSGQGYRVVALLEDQNSMDTVMCYKESGIVYAHSTNSLDLLPPTTTAYWATLYYGDSFAHRYSTWTNGCKLRLDDVVNVQAGAGGVLVARGTYEVDHNGKRFNFVVTN